MGFTGLAHPIPLMFSYSEASIAGASLEVEEEELLRTLTHWSLEEAGQLVLSHHDNREPSGMRKCGMLVTSMYTSPEYHSLDKS